MPVTLRRHAATKKVEGQRKVTFSHAKESFKEAKKIANKHSKHIVFSRASEVNRAMFAAEALARKMGKRNKVRKSKSLGINAIIVNEAKLNEVITKNFFGNELRARNAWLQGKTLNGSVRPAKRVAEDIIKRNLGLGLLAETKLVQKKGFQKNKILLDNVTHSWTIEAVIKRLTKGNTKKPNISNFPKENTGLQINFLKQKNNLYKVRMNYKNKVWDVTKNFHECSLPSVQKKLDV